MKTKLMKKIYLGLLLLTLVGVSCNNGTEKCGPCPLYNAAIWTIAKVRIVDKTSGADLFLSANSPYKSSDLKVTSSTDPNFKFRVDSLDADSSFVPLPDYQSVTYTIQLANLSADHLKINVGLSSQKCCATTEIKNITLNDSLICAPCSLQQDVTIKK